MVRRFSAMCYYLVSYVYNVTRLRAAARKRADIIYARKTNGVKKQKASTFPPKIKKKITIKKIYYNNK